MKKSLAAFALVLALAACAPETTPAEPGPVTMDPTVSIEGISFTPSAVTIEPDTTVTWIWNDGDIEHDVVFDEFESEVQSSGSYIHTFDDTGTYEYLCSLHPNMKGTVFVVGDES